jgi:Ca2+-binding RTX toxin-like protein
MTNVLGTVVADTLFGEADDDLIEGLSGDDFLVGDDGSDTLLGGEGDDTLSGERGSNKINGGPGNDRADYRFADAVDADLERGTAMNGNRGTDTLIHIEDLMGSEYGDTLAGDAGANYLRGRNGDDLILGRGGNDFIRGNDGNDTLNGGAGFDDISYFYVEAAITANLKTGIVQDGTGGTDNLISIEDINGSDVGDDTLLGDNHNNEFDGFGGADIIRGRGGSDSMSGDAGNDTIDGGRGFDFAQYFRSETGIAVSLAKRTGDDGHGGTDRLISIEGVDGSGYDDVIRGDRKTNVLRGHANDDTLVGGDGEDWLWGGTGDDVLRAGAGNDRLSVSFGQDTLNGGAGRDGMTFDRALRDEEDDAASSSRTLRAAWATVRTTLSMTAAG